MEFVPEAATGAETPRTTLPLVLLQQGMKGEHHEQ
jgi:hypothetical protein